MTSDASAPGILHLTELGYRHVKNGGPCSYADDPVLIVDECRVTGSQSEALMAFFAERASDKRIARIAADDSFIPLGKGATLTLPSRDSIVAAARALVA